MGKIHYKRGDYGDSESEFSDSLRISMRTNDLDGAAEAHYFLGAIYEKRGELNKAMGEYKNAAETSESADNEVLEAKSKLGLGRILSRKGKYKDSLKKMKESIATFERLGEDDELPRAYSNAGATAFYIDLDESLEWHEKSMKMANRNNDLRMLGFCLCNVAGCLNEKGEPKKALVQLKEASMISKKLDEKSMICSVDIQTGWAYRLQRKWKDSNGCSEHAVRVAEESDLPYELGDALLNWALVDIDRGDKREAKLKLKRALKVFDKLDNQAKVNDIKDILRGLSR
ncbi:MAG: tetratricopeptide repeat protein [Thermoplasmata archaeon]